MMDAPIAPLWLLLGGVLLCLTAGAGVLPCLVLAARRRARLTGRIAYERCARQLTFLGLCFGTAAAAAGLAALCAVWRGGPAFESAPRLAAWLPLSPWLAGLAIAGGLMCLALRLVEVRSSAIPCLAAGTALCLWTLWIVAVALGLILASPDQEYAVVADPAAPRDAFRLLPGLARVLAECFPAAFGLLAGLACLGLAGAAGLALVVQVLRRAVDDYGRDYYRLAAVWCAVRAAWGGAGLGAGLILASWPPARFAAEPLRVWALACAGLILGAAAAWLGIARSENPLRWKALMLAAALGLAACSGGMAALAIRLVRL